MGISTIVEAWCDKCNADTLINVEKVTYPTDLHGDCMILEVDSEDLIEEGWIIKSDSAICPYCREVP